MGTDLRLRIASTGVGVLILAACSAVGPNYTRPEQTSPSAWSPEAGAAMASAPTSHPTTAPFDPASWWSVFHDAALDRLIAEAVAQNFDLQTAAVRIAEARSQRDDTAAAEYPSVGLTGVGGRQRQSANGIAGALVGGQSSGQGGGGAAGGAGGAGGAGAATGLAAGLYQLGFDATWELDLWGKTRRSVEAANAEIGAAEAARQDATASMTAEIVRNYVTLRGAQQQLAIIDADIAAQRRIFALTDSRARAGFSPQSDASTQSGQLASAEAQRPQLALTAAQSLNRLALLLAEPPGTLVERLAAPQAPLALPPEVPVGLPSDLLQRRPDVQRSEAELRAAVARIGVARAGLFPTVRLGLFGGLQAMRAADLRDWASRFLAGGSAVTLPIFEGGQVRAQIRLADLRSQEAALSYRQTVLSAFHDADNALLAYADEQQRTASLQHQLDQAVRNRTLAEQRHDAGLSPLTEVLSSQRSENAAALSLTQSARSARTDLVALYKALGGGWQGAEATPH